MASDPAYAALVTSVRVAGRCRLRRFREEPDATDAEPAADVDAAWARLEATFSPPKRVRRRSLRVPFFYRRAIRVWRRHPVLWSSIALVAVWLIGVQVDRRYLHPLFYYHAGATEQVVTLPDHSTVWLAPGAYLGTDRTVLKGPRTVYLFGHAHFAVAHDPARPFSVQRKGLKSGYRAWDYVHGG